MKGMKGITGITGIMGMEGIIPWNMGIKPFGAVFLFILLILITPSINGSTYLR